MNFFARLLSQKDPRDERGIGYPNSRTGAKFEFNLHMQLMLVLRHIDDTCTVGELAIRLMRHEAHSGSYLAGCRSYAQRNRPGMHQAPQGHETDNAFAESDRGS